jgi:hypothetical protein
MRGRRGPSIRHRYARDLSKRRRQDFALRNQPMCVGVTITAAVSGPEMVCAFANCLFQVLHENSYVGKRNFAATRLTKEKQIDGTGWRVEGSHSDHLFCHRHGTVRGFVPSERARPRRIIFVIGWFLG